MKNKILCNLKSFVPVLILFLLYASCGKHTRQSEIDTPEIKITRFEEMLFTTDPAVLEDSIAVWQNNPDEFFSHYSYILNLGTTNQPGYTERLREFVTDRMNYEIYSRTMQVFPNLEELTAELSEAFGHYRNEFPDKTIPVVYTFVSGFSQSAITDDSILAIGLDRYLGKDEPLYREVGIYNYLLKNMHPGKIVSDCMNFWGETEFVFNDSVDNLISNMIYRGRMLYFISAMLPDHPDTSNWGFSNQDLRYLEKSEKSIWAFLVEQKLLFISDRFTISKYILEGPFTTDLGTDSPARAAIWTGYRITDSYMRRNPDVTLAELMAERDYLKILNQSGYNP